MKNIKAEKMIINPCSLTPSSSISSSIPSFSFGKIVIVGAVVAGLAVGGYFLYKKFNRRAAASDSGGNLEAKFTAYLSDVSQQDFSLRNIQTLSEEIASFLENCDAAGISPDEVFANQKTAMKFKDVYDALVDFNCRLSESKGVAYEKPKEIQCSSRQVLEAFGEQLKIQEVLVHEERGA